MSTIDKVKNALHLNKENDVTPTRGTTAATGSTVTSRDTAEGVSGPHSSRLANAADPRVDSDNDHSRTLGATNGTSATGGYSGASSGNHALKHTGDQGGISNSTNAGPGNQPEASKGGVLGASGKHATQGSGIAQNTAGPHNSDTLNKLDPRVDSDLSGGKTFGGNITNAGNNSGLDAAHVPPSVFAARHGEPEILHDDPNHDRARRHSVLSHQEQLSGV